MTGKRMTITKIETDFVKVSGNNEPRLLRDCPLPAGASAMDVGGGVWEVWLPEEKAATAWESEVQATLGAKVIVSKSVLETSSLANEV